MVEEDNFLLWPSPTPCDECGKSHEITDDDSVLAIAVEPRPKWVRGGQQQYFFLCSIACLRRAFVTKCFGRKDVVAQIGEKVVGFQEFQENGLCLAEVS